MKQSLMENGYTLLPSEEIPNCCTSCYFLGFSFKEPKLTKVCLLVNLEICLFGICDKYKRSEKIQ